MLSWVIFFFFLIITTKSLHILIYKGTPTKEEWLDGYKLASQVGFKFPKNDKLPLRGLIPNASDEALSLMADMLKYNPGSVIIIYIIEFRS